MQVTPRRLLVPALALAVGAAAAVALARTGDGNIFTDIGVFALGCIPVGIVAAWDGLERRGGWHESDRLTRSWRRQGVFFLGIASFYGVVAIVDAADNAWGWAAAAAAFAVTAAVGATRTFRMLGRESEEDLRVRESREEQEEPHGWLPPREFERAVASAGERHADGGSTRSGRSHE